jgi:hypothetical protein
VALSTSGTRDGPAVASHAEIGPTGGALLYDQEFRGQARRHECRFASPIMFSEIAACAH